MNHVFRPDGHMSVFSFGGKSLDRYWITIISYNALTSHVILVDGRFPIGPDFKFWILFTFPVWSSGSVNCSIKSRLEGRLQMFLFHVKWPSVRMWVKMVRWRLDICYVLAGIWDWRPIYKRDSLSILIRTHTFEFLLDNATCFSMWSLFLCNSNYMWITSPFS